MILLLDNFDSFTYNLADYVAQCGVEYQVLRNNLSIEQIKKRDFQAVILSPGPQIPRKAGNLMRVVDHYVTQLPVLGICLGHQALGEHFGATLTRASKPMHGKISAITCADDELFGEVPKQIEVVRYHSLILKNLPPSLKVIAQTDSADQEIMAFRHKELPVHGIQFHPEAALTEYGLQIIYNWLNFARVVD